MVLFRFRWAKVRNNADIAIDFYIINKVMTLLLWVKCFFLLFISYLCTVIANKMKKALKPIVEQWPLMVAYIVMIGWASLIKNPIPRWLLISFHAYLMAALVTVSGSRWVKVFVYMVIYVLFGFEVVLEQLFGMTISPSVVMLLVETNLRESTEFVESLAGKPQWWTVPLILLIVVVANIIMECYRLSVNRYIWGTSAAQILKGLIILGIVGGVGFSYQYVNLFLCQEMNEVDEWRSHMRNPDDLITKLVVSFYDIKLSEKEMARVILLAEQGDESVIQTVGTDSINVILIIGESFIREHSPLYGYPLQTTPFLCREKQAGRLFVFTDAVSPYNQTTRVLRNLMSCNSLGNGEDWASAPPFTALFKQAGYHVIFYSNQKTEDTDQVFAFSLNTYLYHPRIMKACYDELNDSTFEYDGQLVDYYAKLHRKPLASHQLLLFHLMGQHVSFDYRYPPSFAHFTIDSLSFRQEEWLTDKMRQEIAHYDNALLYNDHVVQQIISLYERNNTVVIYLADHGEEVYDYRDNVGRDDWNMGSDPRQTIRYQYMAPMLVWCSGQYLDRHPDVTACMMDAVNRPMSLDNICQLLFHLSGLRTSYYHSGCDVLSSDYHCPPRLINDQKENEI